MAMMTCIHPDLGRMIRLGGALCRVGAYRDPGEWAAECTLRLTIRYSKDRAVVALVLREGCSILRRRRVHGGILLDLVLEGRVLGVGVGLDQVGIRSEAATLSNM